MNSEETIMDFMIDMDYGVINDQNHLNNLHKHITRTAKNMMLLEIKRLFMLQNQWMKL